MRQLLESMAKRGWHLLEQWFDFDENHQPIIRFVKSIAPLPIEVKNRITEAPKEASPFVATLVDTRNGYSDQSSGLAVETVKSLRRKPMNELSKACWSLAKLSEGEAVSLFVNLSVSESELNELRKEVSEKAKQRAIGAEAMKCVLSPFPRSASSDKPQPAAGATTSLVTDKPLTFGQRENINRRFVEANIKEDLKNKLRQNAIWLGGGIPRF